MIDGALQAFGAEAVLDDLFSSLCSIQPRESVANLCKMEALAEAASLGDGVLGGAVGDLLGVGGWIVAGYGGNFGGWVVIFGVAIVVLIVLLSQFDWNLLWLRCVLCCCC